jgi:hypothetical protein
MFTETAGNGMYTDVLFGRRLKPASGLRQEVREMGSQYADSRAPVIA